LFEPPDKASETGTTTTTTCPQGFINFDAIFLRVSHPASLLYMSRPGEKSARVFHGGEQTNTLPERDDDAVHASCVPTKCFPRTTQQAWDDSCVHRVIIFIIVTWVLYVARQSRTRNNRSPRKTNAMFPMKRIAFYCVTLQRRN